jgi:hypothetical protein
MSLNDLAALGSFVGGAAVLTSLIYLALQVRQAERNQRAAIQQVRASRLADLMLNASHPDLTDAYFKGLSGDESISLLELRQFRLFFRATLYNWEDAYFQHRAKLLDESSFHSTLATMRFTMAVAGARAAWRRQRAMHEQSFVRFVDDLIAETPLVSPRDGAADLADWQADVARERASS